MRRHLSRWGVLYFLALLFLGSWAGQFFAQAIDFANEAREHGSPPKWSEFWPSFWQATFENWQSEFLQLLLQAAVVASVLQSKWFRADYSADKEDVEKILSAIHRLER